MTLHIGYKSPFRTNLLPTNLSGNGLFLFLYGHHYIPVELDEVVFFMRKGHLLPLAKDGKKIQSVADVDFADLRLLAYAPDGASYEYYTDDGETKDYDKPEHFVHITLDADGNAKSDRATVKVEG